MNVRGSLISSKSARIGAFIAEMDYGLAPCVAEAIEEATGVVVVRAHHVRRILLCNHQLSV